MCECVQFTVCANIKQTAGSVIGSGGKSITVGEESIGNGRISGKFAAQTKKIVLDGVDVGLMSSKRLRSPACPDIPKLRCRVAGTGNKYVLVRTKRKTAKALRIA